MTPPEPGSHTATVQVRLLLESELGEKEETLLEYVNHTQALALLQEKDKVPTTSLYVRLVQDRRESLR